MPRGSKPGERRGGRQKGTPNKITQATRDFFSAFLQANHGRAQALWESVAAEDPAKALALLWDASERVVPKLARTEVVGEDGGPVEYVIRDLGKEADGA